MFKTLFCLLLSTVMFSCSKNQPPEVPPIILDKQEAGFILPDKTDEIEIISGNGDYSLVFPKIIHAYGPGGGVGFEIPYSEYSETILSVRLDESDKIVIEWKSRFDLHLEGVFMVKDTKGARRLFSISCFLAAMSGLSGPVDYMYGRLVNDKSYWENY